MTALCALLLSLAVACQSRADWSGVYTFSEDLGRDPGGAAMLVEYRLQLANDSCLLDITGYQVDSHIRCTLEPADSRATVRFLSYGDGTVKNIYGVQVYAVDEPLFTLKRPATGELVTEWGSLAPDSVEEKSGPFFTRQ